MFLPHLRIILISSLLIPLRLSAADHSITSRYSNPDYGFIVQLPRKMSICTTPAPGSNHGFTALLRSDSCEDGKFDRHPRVEVFVMYDTIVMANETKDLSSDVCGRAAVATRTDMLGAGVPVYECAEVDPGPMIRRRYFFLKTRPNEAGVIFNVNVFTSEEKAKGDLKLARKLLAGIRWTGAKLRK